MKGAIEGARGQGSKQHVHEQRPGGSKAFEKSHSDSPQSLKGAQSQRDPDSGSDHWTPTRRGKKHHFTPILYIYFNLANLFFSFIYSDNFNFFLSLSILITDFNLIF